jgi:hypothetical protein
VQQPPAAPLIVMLGEDGWFSQTALPSGRKSPGKPLAQYTVDEYLSAFGRVAAGRGTYTVNGNVLTRKHIDDVNPSQIGWEQVGQFTLDGDAMSIVGKTVEGARIEASFRRMKPQNTIAK